MPTPRTGIYENFRDYLAARFSNAAAIRTFAAEPSIGIAEADFPITGTARSVWQAVLSLALTDGKYDAIVERAIAEGPAAEEPVIREYAAFWKTHPEPVTPTVDLTNPYPGLTPFEEKDHAYFFGRERWVRAILDELEGHSFHSLYGGSGSGKSSLLRAGVIPQWKKQTGGRSVLFTPGPDPFQSLLSMGLQNSASAESLIKEASSGSRVDLFSALQKKLGGDKPLLIVMDQGEQLFTRTTDVRLRESFLNCLHADQDGKVKMVVGIRDDYWAEWNKTLPTRLSSYKLLQPPTKSERQDIVILPARKHRVFFDTRVASLILDSLESDRFALPLLQFFLKELWDNCPPEGGMLELDKYTSFGSVEAKLQEHIKSFLTAFASRESDIHKILLSLVRFDEREGRFLAFARSAPRSTLPEDLVDEMLSDQWRLLTTSPEPGNVEFAHEIIITLWPHFEEFKNQHGVILSVHSDLKEDTLIWTRAKTKRDKTRTLWSGIRLDRALQYAGLGPYEGKVDQFALSHCELSSEQQEFLEAGIEKQEWDRKKIFWAIAGLCCLTVAALAAGSYAMYQAKIATEANAKTNIALADVSWQTAQQSRGAPYANPQSSAIRATHHLLRAAQSSEKAGDLASRDNAILAALIASDHLELSVPHGRPIEGVVQEAGVHYVRCWTTDGRQSRIDLSSPGNIELDRIVKIEHEADQFTSSNADDNSKVQSEERNEKLQAQLGDREIEVSPDGKLLIQFTNNRALEVLNTEDRKVVASLAGGEHKIKGAGFSKDSQRIFLWQTDGSLSSWNFQSGQSDPVWLYTHTGVTGLTHAPNSPFPLTWSSDGSLMSPEFGIKDFKILAHNAAVRGASFNDDGKLCLSWGLKDAKAALWEVSTGKQKGGYLEHESPIIGARFCNPQNKVFTWSHDGVVRVWRLESPLATQLSSLAEQAARFDEMKVEQRKFSRDDHGKPRLTDGNKLPDDQLATHKQRGPDTLSELETVPVRRNHDGQLLLSWHRDGSARVWNKNGELIGAPMNSGEHNISISPQGPIHHVRDVGVEGGAAFSSNGKYIMTWTEKGIVRLWNAHNFQMIVELPRSQPAKDPAKTVSKRDNQTFTFDIDLEPDISLEQRILEFEVRSATTLETGGGLRLFTREEWISKRDRWLEMTGQK